MNTSSNRSLCKSKWYFLWLRRRKQVPKAHNPEKIIIIYLWLRDSEQRWRVINMPSAICIGSKNNVSQVNGQAILAILSIINIYFLWLRKIKQKHFFPFHSKSEQSNLHIWKSYFAKLTLLGWSCILLQCKTYFTLFAVMHKSINYTTSGIRSKIFEVVLWAKGQRLWRGFENQMFFSD